MSAREMQRVRAINYGALGLGLAAAAVLVAAAPLSSMGDRLASAFGAFLAALMVGGVVARLSVSDEPR